MWQALFHLDHNQLHHARPRIKRHVIILAVAVPLASAALIWHCSFALLVHSHYEVQAHSYLVALILAPPDLDQYQEQLPSSLVFPMA